MALLRGLVQRYYVRWTGTVTMPASGTANTTTVFALVNVPVPMRIVPSGADINTLRVYDFTNAATTVTGATIDGSSNSWAPLVQFATGGGLTAYRPYMVINNGASSYLGLNAEY